MPEQLLVKIDAKLEWRVTQTSSGSFVGICDPLGLTSEGGDTVELWLNINESIQLMLNDLLQSGELDHFLRSKGWRATHAIPASGSERVPFDVPIELISQQQNNKRDSARKGN